MTSEVEEESPIQNEKEVSPKATSTPISPGLDVIESNDVANSGRNAKRPRREEATLFLEKTYELLDRCPPELASWTANGDSFVVKEPAAFAEHVIPTYFKHRNFSSFVRQLNLYGFRKVRASYATLEETDPEADVEGETEGLEDASPRAWWEFRHDRFLRGRRDLLCEIKRRASTDAKTLTPSSATGCALVERAELDDLRAEVSALREEVRKLQRTNQQFAGLFQTLLQRSSKADTETSDENVGCTNTLPVQLKALPSLALPSPTARAAPQLALLQLRQGYQAQGTPRDGRTPRTPASGSYLRPVQSLMANLSPSSRPSPRPTPTYVSTPTYSHEQLHRNQLRWYQPTPSCQPSPTTSQSPHKRLRVEAALAGMESQAPYAAVCSPENVAVRELSRIASEIRTELLACITARVTGFLRVHRDQMKPSKEADADAVGEAVGSDIRHKLTLLQASTLASNPKLLDLETICMYRVEILKFISRELPRAVQEAVDKRLPAPEKLSHRPAKDRSLLALLVQKAQKELERQMRTETASIRTGRR